jgi:hypothetical protein
LGASSAEAGDLPDITRVGSQLPVPVLHLHGGDMRVADGVRDDRNFAPDLRSDDGSVQMDWRADIRDDAATERKDSVPRYRLPQFFSKVPGGLAGPRRVGAESVAGISEDAAAGFTAGLRCARSWRVPPNWSALDWYEELHGVAITAASQAEQDHDPSREVPLAGFVFVRVKARTLTRSRQEWRYAMRITPPDREIVEALAGADAAPDSAGVAFESLNRALEQLAEMERWLLDQIFWQHRTEAAIAAELHISQPAISKRKRAALVHLRALL